MENLQKLAGGVSVVGSPVSDEVAVKLVGISFDLLSLRSYSNVNETALFCYV